MIGGRSSMTADEKDQAQIQTDAEFLFSAFNKNLTPRAIAIMKASMEGSGSTSTDFMYVTNAIDGEIEGMIRDSGNLQLIIGSLAMVTVKKLEKMLSAMMLASSKSEKIRAALEKQGIISMNKEITVN